MPRLLCVLGHEDARVRAIACSSVKLLADTCGTWWAPSAGIDVDRHSILAVLKGCAENVDSFQAGSEAIETYLRSLLSRQDAIGSAPARGARKQQQAVVSGGLDQDLVDLGKTAQAFCAFLLSQLPRLFGSPARLNAVPFVLNSIHDACAPADLLYAGLLLLREFALTHGSPPVLGPLKTGLERRVTVELVRLFNDVSLTALLAGPHSSEVVDSLLGMLRVPADDGTEDVRREALRAITPALFEAIPLESQRRDLFVVSLMSSF
jgi:hypothetical protein